MYCEIIESSKRNEATEQSSRFWIPVNIIFMGDYLPLPNRVMHRKPAEAASLGHTEWTSKGESCSCFLFFTNALLRPLTRCLTFCKRSWRGCSVVALFGRNIAIIVEESQTNVVFVNPVSRNSSSSWKKCNWQDSSWCRVLVGSQNPPLELPNVPPEIYQTACCELYPWRKMIHKNSWKIAGALETPNGSRL